MKIEHIDIPYFTFQKFSSCTLDNVTHVKQLPFLSIVQPKEGQYEIQIDSHSPGRTAEKDFFIAPSQVTQKITHFSNSKTNRFTGRYLFMDVILNKTFHIDDVFDFPVTVSDQVSAPPEQIF